jgi:flagellar basal body-associated protein FliL
MKNIIMAVIAIACIVAGGVGGHFLRSMSGGSGDDSHAEKPADAGHGAKDDGHGEKKDDHGSKKDDHGKKPDKKDAHGKKDSHGGDAGSGSEILYYKFSREFVVPIIREGRVHSLVILNLNLEVDGDLSQKLFEMEPKIRDNIMTTLVGLSNDGSTLQSITTVENYESLRSTLLMNLQTVLPSGLQNVLIVDFAKQDV